MSWSYTAIIVTHIYVVGGLIADTSRTVWFCAAIAIVHLLAGIVGMIAHERDGA
tara:strand:- start:45 stop:206 length:162 start_codon:yes stop_codon:yes gene_type:complete